MGQGLSPVSQRSEILRLRQNEAKDYRRLIRFHQKNIANGNTSFSLQIADRGKDGISKQGFTPNLRNAVDPSNLMIPLDSKQNLSLKNPLKK